MLKFFRRIRQKLINDSNLKKYLLYAIGEILLVMIGILLALQVNNWNLNRLDSIRNEKLLLRIEHELESNINRIKFLFTRNFDPYIPFNRRIKNILIEGDALDSLDVLFDQRGFYPNTNPNLNFSAYREAINSGVLYNLDSDSLLQKIEKYYQICERETFYFLKLNQENTERINNSSWQMAISEYLGVSKEYCLKHNEWLKDVNHPEYRKVLFLVNASESVMRRNKAKLERIEIASENLLTSIREKMKN